ncbi:MAG TPA: glycosyltransferase family 39 protein [Candidatus Dormibacteraeota bacterium]|nr:glycosyltransferase family 39 protein [Candidatus Dormibacteraeota bacterium]
MVIVALTLRLCVIPNFLPKRLNPERDHWRFAYETGRIAQSIDQGHGFGSPLFVNTGPSAWMAPVYPYFVAGVFKIFGLYTKASALVLLSLNALFSAITCVPIFLFARESFGNRVAMWSGWAWAFFPYAIYFPVDRIWDTWLATLLLSILFLMVLRLQSSSRTLSWIYYGALWGLAGLTDPSVLSVLPVLGIWVCYRRYKQGLRWFAPNVAAALVFIAVMSPWFVRNYRAFHQFVPIRDDLGLELHVGNNGDTSSWHPTMAGPWHNGSEWNEYLQRGELAYMADEKRQALAYIEQHPVWFVGVASRRVVYIWTGFWSFNRQYLADQPFDPANIFFCSSLTILVLLGLRRAFRDGVAVGMPYLIVLLFFPLIYYVTHPEDWYRRPIDPFCVVLAVYAVVSWLRNARRTPEKTAPPLSLTPQAEQRSIASP